MNRRMPCRHSSPFACTSQASRQLHAEAVALLALEAAALPALEAAALPAPEAAALLALEAAALLAAQLVPALAGCGRCWEQTAASWDQNQVEISATAGQTGLQAVLAHPG